MGKRLYLVDQTDTKPSTGLFSFDVSYLENRTAEKVPPRALKGRNNPRRGHRREIRGVGRIYRSLLTPAAI
ncbi:unnamed protein product [Nesidiocoris tenuis]|uniref:Uncharacterized protein n=1 Tax=Nesidiocoris tenuis TaxID=355587 RepID=A0A6H5HUM0_9HEMI|nr:unnamed protein product [Nesidiocoris tenuis]